MRKIILPDGKFFHERWEHFYLNAAKLIRDCLWLIKIRLHYSETVKANLDKTGLFGTHLDGTDIVWDYPGKCVSYQKNV